MNDKTSCTSCSIKTGCIKRGLTLYMLFIQTGRSDELTDQVREKFDCGKNCENWLPTTTTSKEKQHENH